LKGKALDIDAEDYETGKIDVDGLYKGKGVVEDLDSEFIRKLYTDGSVDCGPEIGKHINNHYYILRNGKSSSLAYYNPDTEQLNRVDKSYIYGVKPRNAEQTFAIHALLNPEIRLVTIQGVAGTGKTLLALASALEQHKSYKQIILARPIVPLSNRDIGYLPGDASEKINPYMEPLWDNLKFIKDQFKENEKRYKQIRQMQDDKKIVITPLAYIRGRSLANIFFIIDEAQNLTPHEVKTIVSRAGENTKIIFTGDIHQIDTPYLDEKSNGLSYIIDRLRGNKLFAHVTLEKGERSELANLANELL
jgi:PhoH-like ATPase